MARDIKAELNPEDSDNIPELPESEPLSPIQIQISEDMQKTLVQVVLEDYESAKTAREKKEYGSSSKGEKLSFDRWFKGLRDLYNARREPKTIPWKYCSNRSLRIAAAILDMLHARMFASVVNEDLLQWKPGGVEDYPKVERIEKLMHWWVWVRCRARSFFDNWIKTVIGYGENITESYWKVRWIDKGQTQSEPQMDEQGMPVMGPDGQPMVKQFREPVPFEQSQSRVYLRDQFYLQEHSIDIEQEPVILEENFLYRELEQAEMEGQSVNISNLLKSKLKSEIPVLTGITPDEAERVKNIKIRNIPVKILKWYGKFDADGDGFDEDIRILISPEHELYLGGVSVRDLTYSGKRPICFNKFESRFDCPFENDGEGVIEKVRELAEEIDAIFNQLTDANTLSILRPGFYDSAGDIDAPVLRLAPNQINPVSNPESINFPDINIPTERLINAIRLVLEFVERLTAASSYVLGKESEIVGGSGTATRTNAILQSAEQRFALPTERLREGAAKIINQYLDLLQLNIPPGLETRILGEDGEPLFGENELSKEGIAGEFDAFLLPDPSMGSKAQERELAQMFYSLLLQNMIVGSDPVKIYKVTADLIKAYDKDPELYLGPEPTSDMIDDPADENTLMIQGDFGRVRAQMTENHMEHIKVHMDLMQSPSLAELPPHLAQEVTQYNQQHIQEHQLMMQTMMGLISQFGGGKKGGMGGENNAGGGEMLEGTQESPGLENIQGPLGQALNTKREGEVGIPS